MQSLQHYARLAIFTRYVDYSDLPHHFSVNHLGLPHVEVIERMRRDNTKDRNDGLRISAQMGFMHSLMFFKSIGATNFNSGMLNAARNGHIDIVKQCKEWGALNYNWALKEAAKGGHVDIVVLLKEYGAYDFFFALDEAALYGYVEVFKILISWLPSTVGLKRSWEGAAREGRYDMVKLLIELDPDYVDRGMAWATLDGHINVVRLCKENGGKDFKPVYHYASMRGHIELIKLCKEWNVIDDIDVVLCNASRHGHTDIVKLSKEYGAVEFKWAYDLARRSEREDGNWDICGHDRYGLLDLLKEWKDTHFDWLMNKAATKGDIELLRECKEKGAVSYNTAMKFAAAEGHMNIVLILKQWGADDFVIASQKAAKNGHIEILQLFKEWGLTDFEKAIKAATSGNHIKILKMFREWGVATTNTDFYSFTRVSWTRDIQTFLLDWKASLIIPPSPMNPLTSSLLTI
jgi:hypothetical protein